MNFFCTLLIIIFLVGCFTKKDNTPFENKNLELVTLVNKKEGGKIKFSFYPSSKNEVVALAGSLLVTKNDFRKDKVLNDLIVELESKEKAGESENSYLLQSMRSQIFQRKLNIIESRIKNQALFKEAKNLEINVQDYIAKYIYSRVDMMIYPSVVDKYISQNLIPEGVDGRLWAKKKLQEQKRQKAIDYILEKYVLELPIKVYLDQPSEGGEMSQDWTFFEGPKNSSLKVFMVSRMNGFADRSILSALMKLKEKYKNLFIGIRPLLKKNDMRSYMRFSYLFCSYEKRKTHFMDLLLELSFDHNKDLESWFDKSLVKARLPFEAIKKCVLESEYKDILEYHAQYSSFLRAEAGPILWIGGEVFIGAMDVKRLEAIIDRKLNLPTAATW